MVTFTADSAAI